MRFPGRSFQLWEYHVSHGMMLVRSPVRTGILGDTNIDIMFAGVEYVDLPRHLDNLSIADPDPPDLKVAQDRLGKAPKAANVFVLVSDNRRFIVVASVMKVAESDMDIFESPFKNPYYGNRG